MLVDLGPAEGLMAALWEASATRAGQGVGAVPAAATGGRLRPEACAAVGDGLRVVEAAVGTIPRPVGGVAVAAECRRLLDTELVTAVGEAVRGFEAAASACCAAVDE